MLPKMRYPRPQLQRSDWICLNGPWSLRRRGRFGRPVTFDWPHTIEVPFAPEAEAVSTTRFSPKLLVRAGICLDGGGEGRVLLHFGAVDYRARVWVNSQFIADHQGGHTPFTVDITPVLNEFGPQRVTVWAADDPMTWLNRVGSRIGVWNHSMWYPRTSGIWQTVWAERVGATYIDRIRWTPEFERWEIGLKPLSRVSSTMVYS